MEFVDFLDSVTVVSSKAIKERDYKKSGKYPIVSQGKDLINGYTDDNEHLIKVVNTLVGFGDHTKIIKLIDFSFIKGADGLKVLNVNSDFLPKYFYYWLKSIDLRNLGYSRHFKLLKEYKIPLVSIEEQETIVNKLDNFSYLKNDLINNSILLSEKIESFKESILKEELNILQKEFTYE